MAHSLQMLSSVVLYFMQHSLEKLSSGVLFFMAHSPLYNIIWDYVSIVGDSGDLTSAVSAAVFVCCVCLSYCLRWWFVLDGPTLSRVLTPTGQGGGFTYGVPLSSGGLSNPFYPAGFQGQPRSEWAEPVCHLASDKLSSDADLNRSQQS